jgi:MYXO-CTERM domain-containing protein
VIITAPVSQRLRGNLEENPYAYGICKDATDNPFRAAVFSDEPPTEVTLEITGGPTVGMLPVLAEPRVFYALVDTTTVSAGDHTVTVTAVADGQSRSDAIIVEFTDGPCDPLPGTDPELGSLGGFGGAGGAGGNGGTGGAGGAGATGGSGGEGATASGGSAGSGLATGGAGAGAGGPGAAPILVEEGDCGCRVVGGATSNGGGARLAGLLGLGLLPLVRRRRSAVQRSR